VEQSPAPLSIPFESQADRRRAQLIRTAALLIESEGIENLSMAAVARAAGCTRQVVHSYFARREDLLRAVLVDFHKVLRRKLAALDELVKDPTAFDPEQLATWGVHVRDAAWDLLEEEGMAGLILMAAPPANPSVKQPLDQLRRPLIDEWMSYIAPMVPAKLDAEMIIELWIATFHRLAVKWRTGDLTRAEGIALLKRYSESLLLAFAP